MKWQNAEKCYEQLKSVFYKIFNLVLVLINQRLKSTDAGIVIKTIQTFRDNLPPSDCLRVAALLLITQHMPIQRAVGRFTWFL